MAPSSVVLQDDGQNEDDIENEEEKENIVWVKSFFTLLEREMNSAIP